jgi:hypothetical protein
MDTTQCVRPPRLHDISFIHHQCAATTIQSAGPAVPYWKSKSGEAELKFGGSERSGSEVGDSLLSEGSEGDAPAHTWKNLSAGTVSFCAECTYTQKVT